MVVSKEIEAFLIRAGGRRYCVACLQDMLAIPTQAQAARAVRELISRPAFRVEMADCARCGRFRKAARSLWVGV
jgi:hypothetical protein